MPSRITLSLDWARVGLLVVILGTLANSFFAALQTQYVSEVDTTMDNTQQKFLGFPGDLHADLVAYALCFPPFTPIDATAWPYPYRKYLLQNHYHSFDLSSGKAVDITTWSLPLSPEPGESWEYTNPSLEMAGWGLDRIPSGLHTTQLMLLITMLMKRLIIAKGPLAAVALHYALAFLALAAMCVAMLADWPRRLLAFAGLAMSYPFLEILLRGNQGALFAGTALIFFIYLACRTDHYILAALLLAVACNFRPNAVVLAPLLLCFGLRTCFISGGIFGVTAALLFFVSYRIDLLMYPGYSLSYFREALKHYYTDGVLGAANNAGNNSFFGALKLTYLYITHTHSKAHPHLFSLLNTVVTLVCGLLELGACALYLLRRLRRIDFAFLLVALYTLASSVLATYHLFIFAVFPLLLGEPKFREFDRFDFAILGASVFVLIPKVYFFHNGISPDAILNPLVLLAAVIYLMVGRLRPGAPTEVAAEEAKAPV